MQSSPHAEKVIDTQSPFTGCLLISR